MPDQFYEYRTFEAAMAAIEASVGDVQADYPDLSLDDIHHDLTLNVMLDCTPVVRHQLARSHLGWDPEEDKDLYVQHKIPTKIGEQW